MPHKLLSAGATAAVPNAVWNEIESLDNGVAVPLGHAFELYCPFFDNRRGFNVVSSDKPKALKAVAACAASQALDDALSNRTRHLALQNTDTLTVPLQSISGFITGSGIDHPSENGLSFLRPYGVPCLAGSGIKGVLRSAAERKALVDLDPGWSIADVWWLFGWEGQPEYRLQENELHGYFQAYLDKAEQSHKHSIAVFLNLLAGKSGQQPVDKWLAQLAQPNSDNTDQLAFRGLLDFWDMPLTEANGAVDVMTPHYGEYYEGNASPHDAADPVPISMLVIKAGAEGRLTIQWRGRGLQGESEGIGGLLQNRWQTMLSALIDDVIKWDGFGAKTAVGYGRFKVNAGLQRKESRLMEDKEQKAADERRARVDAELSRTESPEQTGVRRMEQAIAESQGDYNSQLKGALNELIDDACNDEWDTELKRKLETLFLMVNPKPPGMKRRKKEYKERLNRLRK